MINLVHAVGKKRRSLVGSKGATLIVLSLFASLEFGNRFDLTLGGVKITVFDLALLSVLAVVALRMCVRRQDVIYLTSVQMCGVLLLFLFLMVETGGLVQDPAFPRNVTLVIAVVRMVALLLIVSQLAFDESVWVDHIANVGFLFSAVAIVLYFLFAVRRYDTIRSTPALWYPGLVYYLGEAASLRLTGLWQDPNFFFVVNLGPFVGCLYRFMFTKKLTWAIKSATIFGALFLTFSRSGYLLLALLIIICAVRFWRRLLRLLFSKRGVVLVFVVVLLILLMNYLAVMLMGSSLQDLALARIRVGIERGSGEKRFQRWQVAWEGFLKRPFFGNGGRYVLRTSGQYAHNDYLEILSSHGLVGFFPVMCFYFWALWIGWHKAQHDPSWEVCFWTFTFTAVIGGAFFTIFYNSIIWLWASLLLSCPLARSEALARQASLKHQTQVTSP